MDKFWVDPPEGWRHGFPAVWDSIKEPDMLKWLMDKGYPDRLIKEFGEFFYVRQWKWEENDE